MGIANAGEVMNPPEQQASPGADGFLRSFGESIKTHFDERLRSPFGGAFIIAWVAANWEPLLILALGNRPIEERIAFVTHNHFSLNSTVVQPLWMSLLIALVFYLLSALFVAIYGGYELAKNWIERRFEAHTWAAPSTFLAYKQRSNNRIKYLEELATENLGAVQEEIERTNDANQKLVTAQAELNEVSVSLAQKNSELASSLEEVRRLSAIVELAGTEAANYAKTRQAAQAAASEIYDLVLELQAPLEQLKLQTQPSAWNTFLRLRHRVREIANTDFDLDKAPISAATLSQYLQSKIPELPINEALLKRVVSDIQHAKLTDLTTIGDVDQIISATWIALVTYSKARPELFRSSVDYLSKSLGFAFEEFRRTHKFSKETVAAFSEFSHLVAPLRKLPRSVDTQ